MSRERTAEHGSRRRYANGCRCWDCRMAIRFYGRERHARAASARVLSGPRSDGAHGTLSEYDNHACRCHACKAAKSVANAAAARRRKVRTNLPCVP